MEQTMHTEEYKCKLASEKRRLHALAIANASWAAEEISERQSGENRPRPRA